MGVICTVIERTDNEFGDIKKLKIRIEAFDSEADLENLDELKALKPYLDIVIRVVLKSGKSMTIKATYNVSLNLRDNLKKIFGPTGYNSTHFKIFSGDRLVGSNSEFEQVFEFG